MPQARAVMTHINQLPVEILTRFFTVGAEDDHEEDDSFLSRPKHMKPFIVRTSLVCQHWREIAHSKSNFHFWRTSLRLGFPGYLSAIEEASEFKKAFDTAEDSDVTIWWNSAQRH